LSNDLFELKIKITENMKNLKMKKEKNSVFFLKEFDRNFNEKKMFYSVNHQIKYQKSFFFNF